MTTHGETDSARALHGTRLSAAEVFTAIRRDGEEELRRPWHSLFWSAIAAGFTISISILAKAYIHSKLPEADWVGLIDNLGYAIGFLIVILGRMQLFTENTITAVLPVLERPRLRALGVAARLWAIVFAANIVGTFGAAVFIHFALTTPELLQSIITLGEQSLGKGPLKLFLSAIPAGFLVAAIVWMLPNGRGTEFWIISTLAYVIGVCGFAHVIVGATQAFLMLFATATDLVDVFGGFVLPAAAGNIIGGTLLFSLLAYGQVRRE